MAQDLVIQFGSAQAVDFSGLLERDIDGVKYGDYIEVAKGTKTAKEVFDYDISRDEFMSIVGSFIWDEAVLYTQPRLHGWGGREQGAYAKEFFNRVGLSL